MCPGRLAAPKVNTSATTYGLAALVCHICPLPRKHHGAEASRVGPGLRRAGDKLAVGTEATCRADGYTVHRVPLGTPHFVRYAEACSRFWSVPVAPGLYYLN